MNKELKKFHKEVIDNLCSIKWAYLRMNKSIQSEGTFGILKQDRGYKRLVRKGLKAVTLEVYIIIAIGYNSLLIL